MELVIQGHVIDTPISEILKQLKIQSHTTKLKEIGKEVNHNIAITCPVHKHGMENHPSCHVFTKKDDTHIEYGTCHCFTCGWTSGLSGLVSLCFNEDNIFAERWLIENFSSRIASNCVLLPEIQLKKVNKTQYLDEKILKKYDYYHPYMWKRKLTKEIVDKFKVGFDPELNMLTFPVWNEKGKLVTFTRRSVNNKKFLIDDGTTKPIYLLNFVLQEHHKQVIVCEGQIDALVAWSYGFPAIALMGAGTSKDQIDILNKTSILHFILMYDNDEAGRKGAKRFKSMINKDKFITDILMPPHKDVGDCSKEEFYDILKQNKIQIS